MLKNLADCHPEEPQAVLSETKEGSLHVLDSTNAGILRKVYPARNVKDPSASPREDSERAQNDTPRGFFRNLLSRHRAKLSGSYLFRILVLEARELRRRSAG